MTHIVRHAAMAGLLLGPLPALAQEAGPLSGFYMGLYAGAGFIHDQDIDTDVALNGLGIESDTSVEYDPSLRFGGYLGYHLDTNIRLQLDVGYTWADADNKLDIDGDEVKTDQETEILSGTAGIFFDLWPVGILVPYIGAGAGVAHVETNLDAENGIGDSKQTVLTAFAEAGLPIDLTPGFAIVPSARFSWYDTKEKKDDIEVNALGNLIEFDASTITENLYETQLLLSARYTF